MKKQKKLQMQKKKRKKRNSYKRHIIERINKTIEIEMDFTALSFILLTLSVFKQISRLAVKGFAEF